MHEEPGIENRGQTPGDDVGESVRRVGEQEHGEHWNDLERTLAERRCCGPCVERALVDDGCVGDIGGHAGGRRRCSERETRNGEQEQARANVRDEHGSRRHVGSDDEDDDENDEHAEMRQ